MRPVSVVHVKIRNVAQQWFHVMLEAREEMVDEHKHDGVGSSANPIADKHSSLKVNQAPH